MTVTAYFYGYALAGALGGTNAGSGCSFDWLSDTINVALATAYTPNQDTHQYWASASANEIANGNGYATGGSTLAGKTMVYTAAENAIHFDADDLTWGTATISASQAVIYDTTTAGSPLLGWVDFGGTVSSTSGDFKITWGTAGLFTITPANATGYP